VDKFSPVFDLHIKPAIFIATNVKKDKKYHSLCTTHAIFLLEKKGSWPNYTLEMSYSWFVYVFTSTGALGKLGSTATKGTIFNFHFTSPCTYGPYMLYIVGKRSARAIK